MNIALDYDGTYTADPNMWLRFVEEAQLAGHKVFIVTMRYESECFGRMGKTFRQEGFHLKELREDKQQLDKRLLDAPDHAGLGCEVVATGRKAKKPFCEQRGIIIDIWIDDNPEAVIMDAERVFGSASPEGEVIIQEPRSKTAMPRYLQPKMEVDWSGYCQICGGKDGCKPGCHLD